jgi:cysteine-rich repeat protein
VVVSFAAVADTFIESGAEASIDHGGMAEVEVDRQPFRIAYFKFDLRNAPGQIGRATLRLYSINGAPDGGTIYPVPDSSWDEGSGNGTALGGGLVWTQVDSNGDGTIDARDPSPWVPDFGRPIAALRDVDSGETYTIDVTAAFLSGSQVYTLALASSINNGTVYASRSHGTAERRPLLTIETTGALCGDGVTQGGEECDDGNTTSCDGCSGCERDTLTTCGSFAPVADTYIEAEDEATWDHGTSHYFDVDAAPTGIAYLKFDLRGLTTTFSRATLKLHCINESSDGGTIYVVPDSGWIEGTRTGVNEDSAGGPGLKWTQVDTNGDGIVDSRDASPFVPDSSPIASLGPVVVGQTYLVDVSDVFQSGPGLYTLAIRSNNGNGTTYSSRNDPVVSERPALLLEP